VAAARAIRKDPGAPGAGAAVFENGCCRWLRGMVRRAFTVFPNGTWTPPSRMCSLKAEALFRPQAAIYEQRAHIPE